MTRYYGVSLLRVVAMMMIVLCHIAYYVDTSWMAQFLNVGVYVFLLISGWLYSTKVIQNGKTWIIQRWEKLCIPVLIWIAMVIIYSAVVEHETPFASDVLLHLFNLQGASWVFTWFPAVRIDGILAGCINLWFVTVMMMCYGLVLLVKRNERAIKVRPVMSVLAIAAFIAFAQLGINLAYFICFFIGYFWGKEKSKTTWKNYGSMSVAMVAAMACRLISRSLFDDTVMYNVVIVGITHTVLALWLFYTVLMYEQKSNSVERMVNGKFIKLADQYSYYIYITHDFFLSERFGLRNMIPGTIPQLLLFSVLTLCTAFIVKYTTEFSLERLNKKVME